MIRPTPRKPIGTLPSARQYPDPQNFEDLSRLGDEITELAAHLAAGTCELLELIGIFDEEEGWCFPGIRSSATAPALLYLLRRPPWMGKMQMDCREQSLPCSRVPTG